MTKFGFFMIFETTTILIFEKWLGYHKWHLRQVAQTFSQTHSWAVQSWGDQNYGSYYNWTRSCSLLESKIQLLQR